MDQERQPRVHAEARCKEWSCKQPEGRIAYLGYELANSSDFFGPMALSFIT